MRVEATFQDQKSRGWNLEKSLITDLARLERLLLGLFMAMWSVCHLAASCGPFLYAFKKCQGERGELPRKMCKEGIFIIPDGSYRHTVYYSIIQSEWPSVKARLETLMQR